MSGKRRVVTEVTFGEQPTCVISMEPGTDGAVVRLYVDGRLDATYRPVPIDQALRLVDGLIQGREPSLHDLVLKS